MKNLIVNIFKTLFFFDLAVVVIYALPELTAKSAALLKLEQEAMALGVPLVLSLIYFFGVEKRKLGVPVNKRVFKSFVWGLGFGVILLGVVVGAMWLLKKVDFISIGKPESIWLWLAAILCNALATELLFRGYLFNLYKKFYGFIASTVITTLFFVSLNFEIFKFSKIYIANMILFNILLCLILEYTGSVIATVFARFFYTGISCYLFGSLPLSGGYPALLKVEYSGKAIITGGEKGIEGSVITLIVLLLITLFLFNRKYNLIKLIKIKYKDLVWFIKRTAPKLKKVKKAKT